MKIRWLIIGLICLFILSQNAIGEYKGYATYEGERGPESLTPVDIDKDNDIDLVMICNGDMEESASCIQYLINDGNGKFEKKSDDKTNTPYLLDSSDMDNDGDFDLVILDDVSIKFLSNDGTGTFTETWSYEMSIFLYSDLKTLDLNGDNKNDIAFYDSVNLHLFLSGDTEKFTYSKVYLNTTSFLYWYDMDSDGDTDIFATYSGMKLFDELIEPPKIEIYLNQGNGSFEEEFIDEPEFMAGLVEIGKMGSDEITIFIQDYETNDIKIYSWDNSILNSKGTIPFIDEYDTIDAMKLFDIDNDADLELLILRSSNVMYQIIRIYDNVLSDQRTKTDFTVTSETTGFCLFKGDKDASWDLAGWEGSELFSSGNKVWVSLQNKDMTVVGGDGDGTTDPTDTEENDTSKKGAKDDNTMLLIAIVVVIIIVVMVLGLIFINKKKKQKMKEVEDILRTTQDQAQTQSQQLQQSPQTQVQEQATIQQSIPPITPPVQESIAPPVSQDLSLPQPAQEVYQPPIQEQPQPPIQEQPQPPVQEIQEPIQQPIPPITTPPAQESIAPPISQDLPSPPSGQEISQPPVQEQPQIQIQEVQQPAQPETQVQMVPCPTCQNMIAVYSTPCQHCGTNLNW